MVRRRRTRAEVQQLASEFMGSGMRRSEFCRQRHLSWSTLQRHLKGQRKKCKPVLPSCQLVDVELATRKPMAESESSCGLVVLLSSGYKIEVQRNFDSPTLERLVNVLERV